MLHVLQHGWYPYKYTLICIKLPFYIVLLFFYPRMLYHLFLWHDVHTFQLKRVKPPGFSFQIVNTNMDQFSPRACRRSALLTWQHIVSLPPSLPVVYCGGFNTPKESTIGHFLLGRSRYSLTYRCLAILWSCPTTCLLNVYTTYIDNNPILNYGSSVWKLNYEYGVIKKNLWLMENYIEKNNSLSHCFFAWNTNTSVSKREE